MKMIKIKGSNIGEVKADLKAKGLKFKDKDVDDIVAKSVAVRDIIIEGKPKKIRVKLDTLQAICDDDDNVVAWVYEETEG